MGDEENIGTSNIFWSGLVQMAQINLRILYFIVGSSLDQMAQINLRILYFIVGIVRCLSIIHIKNRLSITVAMLY